MSKPRDIAANLLEDDVDPKDYAMDLRPRYVIMHPNGMGPGRPAYYNGTAGWVSDSRNATLFRSIHGAQAYVEPRWSEDSGVRIVAVYT